MKAIFGIISGIAALVGLSFILSYTDYAQYSFFAPRMEQVRYNTFKQSQSYNEGMARDLENLQMEYAKADATQKPMLRAVILHRFEAYQGTLPANLDLFYNQLRNQ